MRVSKRDARCWFDQLQAPRKLHRWFAKPPVQTRDLLALGVVTEEDVRDALKATGAAKVRLPRRLWPVSRVWPMGFSWSSYVAQEELISVSVESGLSLENILSCDAPAPKSFDEAFALATDDAMFFSNAGVGKTRVMAKNFDLAFSGRGGLKNHNKDIDDQLNATCVGVQLENGTHLGVPPSRCMFAVSSVVDLFHRRFAFPKEVHQFLGVLQWYDLLFRAKLSVYDHVYQFVRDREDMVRRVVPIPVLRELLVATMLGIFWRFDLRRTAFRMPASRSVLVFSMQRCLTSQALMAARDIHLGGCYQLLDCGVRSRAYMDRQGVERYLPLPLDGFTHVLSTRARWDDLSRSCLCRRRRCPLMHHLVVCVGELLDHHCSAVS